MGLGTEDLITFLLTTFALSVVPGPDMTYMATTTLRGGFKMGMAAFSAVLAGCLIHVSLATAGLTALFTTLPYFFTALQYIGAAYLLYIAFQLAFEKRTKNSDGTASASAAKEPLQARKIMQHAFLINLTNPKLGLFFIAFLPQFINPVSTSPTLQTFTLGILFITIGNVFNLLAILLTAYTAHKVSVSGKLERYIKKGAAFLLTSFALRLAIGDSE